MMVEDAVKKMRSLMITLEDVDRFRNIREKWSSVVLISLSSIFASIVIFILIAYIDYLDINPFLYNLQIYNAYFGAGLFATIAWLAGILLIYGTLNRAYRSITPTNWEDDLREGPIGIIKIMSRYDWNKKLLELRRAKQGFVIVTALQMLFNLFFVFVVTFIGFGLLASLIFQITPNGYLILLISVVFTLILGDKYLKRLRERLWNADILIAELGRFYSEFSEREL